MLLLPCCGTHAVAPMRSHAVAPMRSHAVTYALPCRACTCTAVQRHVPRFLCHTAHIEQSHQLCSLSKSKLYSNAPMLYINAGQCKGISHERTLHAPAECPQTEQQRSHKRCLLQTRVDLSIPLTHAHARTRRYRRAHPHAQKHTCSHVHAHKHTHTHTCVTA